MLIAISRGYYQMAKRLLLRGYLKALGRDWKSSRMR